MADNPLSIRFREASASRIRDAEEQVPEGSVADVLKHYWHQKEAQYTPGIFPSGKPNEENILDLDVMYDNNPHDGTETPFGSGTKTMWCIRYLAGTCPYGGLCGFRHGQCVVKYTLPRAHETVLEFL